MPALVYTQHHDTSSFCLVERSCGGLGALESAFCGQQDKCLKSRKTQLSPFAAGVSRPEQAVAASGVLHGCPLNPEP